jgi:hypothetical protein
MVHPAIPASVSQEQILRLKHILLYQLMQSGSDGHRIVQDAERIHVAPEFIFRQQIANIFGKTRAKEHNLFRMSDFRLPFRQFYLRSESHRFNYLLKFRGKIKHNTHKSTIFARHLSM